MLLYRNIFIGASLKQKPGHTNSLIRKKFEIGKPLHELSMALLSRNYGKYFMNFEIHLVQGLLYQVCDLSSNWPTQTQPNNIYNMEGLDINLLASKPINSKSPHTKKMKS